MNNAKPYIGKTKVVLSVIAWIFLVIFPPIYVTHSCRKAVKFFQFEKAYESMKVLSNAGELVDALLDESSMEEQKKEQIVLLFDFSEKLVSEIEDMNNRFSYEGCRKHIYTNAFLSLLLEGFSLGWITMDFIKSKKKNVDPTKDTDVQKET